MYRLKTRRIIHMLSTLCRLIFLLTLCFQGRDGFAQGPPPAKVRVSPVVREAVQHQISLIGTVESWRTSRVASEASGRVEALLVRRGASVKKSQVLARLGASELLLKLKESEARGNAAIARLAKARDDLKRAEKLMKASLVSEKIYREAKHSLREMEESVIVNKAAKLQLEDLLSKKEVRAPFTGIVTKELISEGEWLTKGDSVLQLVDASKVRILMDLPEKYVSDVLIGATVQVEFDAIPGESFSGIIHALVPEGDRSARIFPLEIHVENTDFRIKEGMLARMRFELGRTRSVLMAHKDAVIRKDGQAFLFVVAEGKAFKQSLKLGKSKGSLIEINGDIQEGAQVVIRGNERLRNGQTVQVVPK